MTKELTPEAIAYAVWREAGCGNYKPRPEEIQDITKKSWMAWVWLTNNRAWPMPWENLERFAKDYEKGLFLDLWKG